MDMYPICCNRFYEDPCDPCCDDDLDLFDPYSCFNVFPSRLCAQTSAFRCPSESPSPRQSADNAAYNAKRRQSDASSIDSSKDTTTDKKNVQATQDTAHPEKFCIHLNVSGYDPKTIQIKVEGGKLIVEANQEDRQNGGDYNIRQFRKSYELPKQADVEHITSNVMPDGILVIDIPLRAAGNEDRSEQSGTNKNQASAQPGQHRASLSDYINLLINSDFNPRLRDQDDGTRILDMSIDVKGCPPEEIKVSLKNNELIVCGECKHKENRHSKRSRFFRSTTLPAGAQTNQMKTELNDDGRLKIEVPLH